MEKSNGEPKTLELLVANEIKNHRSRNGLSRIALAKKSGVSYHHISRLENAKCSPSVLTCLKLATALGVRLSDIVREVEHATLI